MRVVGGRFGGCILAPLGADMRAIRPTSERMRESLFNCLAHGGFATPPPPQEMRVLDLFAGAGASFRVGKCRRGAHPRWQAAFPFKPCGGHSGRHILGAGQILRFAVKPTSSILLARRSVDQAGRETEIVTRGRHDPCVGLRAVPVGEAMMACVLLDHLLLHRGQTGARAAR